MNIYIDESGSIDRHAAPNHHFIISMIHVHDIDKLSKSFKRFVSSNYSRLLELDEDKTDPDTERYLRPEERCSATESSGTERRAV